MSDLPGMKVTIEVEPIELVALDKLSLVNHALALRGLSFSARQELEVLVKVLDDVVRRIKLAREGIA